VANGEGRHLSIGRVAGVPVRVSPTWIFVAVIITIGFKPLVSRYLPDLGSGTYVVAFAFAVLLYVSVFLHEMSHALTARGFGLPVRAITLHFLGGHTEIEREAPTPGRDIAVSAAGPAVSLLIGGAAYLASMPVDADVAEFLLFELAAANLVVGLFNLLPALPLDGGHMLRAAVWHFTGDETRGSMVAARAGQVLAVGVLAVPFVISGGQPGFVGIIWAALVAMLLWSGASQALAVARMRQRLPGLDTRRLARRAAPVAPDLPISEALKHASQARVASLVVVDSAGRPVGLVNEAAVAAIPEERRPWVTAGQSARSLEPGMVLGLGLVGDELLRAMRATPASEYLVVDENGHVYGVLSSADVEAALAPR
jgi:Zn-dependent protease/CBS domain-containing protein